jgi:4Fe-4S ferredoxin
MKWPLVDEIWKGSIRILRTEYLTRTTEIALDTDKCTTCNQCTKVCPKEALVAVKIVPGIKKTKLERVPTFPNPNKCVFCGICMSFCPYHAIEMRLDGQVLQYEDLPLVKGKILPKMNALKVGKVELADPAFTSTLFNRTLQKIEIKRLVK